MTNADGDQGCISLTKFSTFLDGKQKEIVVASRSLR